MRKEVYNIMVKYYITMEKVVLNYVKYYYGFLFKYLKKNDFKLILFITYLHTYILHAATCIILNKRLGN